MSGIEIPGDKISKTSKSTTDGKNTSKTSLIGGGDEAKEIHKIKILVVSCENLRTFYPFADIQVKCEVGENVIGVSWPVPITDGESIEVLYAFEFRVDFSNIKEIDYFVTYPAFLHFNQIKGTFDRHVYPQLQPNENLHAIPPAKSFDSIVSLYEALEPNNNILMGSVSGNLPKKKSRSAVKGGAASKSSIVLRDKLSKAKGKDSKSSIENKSSTRSKSTLSSKKRSSQSFNRTSTTSTDPATKFESESFGMCVIDFLPLICGQKTFTQSLLIKPVNEYQDDRMLSFKKHPKVTVTVSTEAEIEFNSPTFLNFTVESIYNIPSLIETPAMDYRMCCVLPMLHNHRMPLIFSNPIIIESTQENMPKCWPGIQRIGYDTNTTQYRTPIGFTDIQSKFDKNVDSYIKKHNNRLQFLMMKRHLLLRDSVDELAAHIKKYQRIVLEFFMVHKSSNVQRKISGGGGAAAAGGGGGVSTAPSGTTTSPSTKNIDVLGKKPKFGPNLHLMALVDLSTLLYPGVTRLRVSAPLTTFSMEEAILKGGLEDSYFLPTKKKEDSAENGKGDKVHKEKEEKVKEEKTPRVTTDESMKYKLPLRPPECMDPYPVFHENGHPCFVVVEIELSKSLLPKKDIEDLTKELSQLVHRKDVEPKESISKVILSSCISVDHYIEILNGMIYDLNEKYQNFTQEDSSAVEENGQPQMKNFILFLKNKGVYNSYVDSISKMIPLLVANKYQLNSDTNSKEYQKLIGDVFVFLVSKMNETVNKLICHGMEPCPGVKKIDNNLLYAKEALETGRIEMAERYLLERICDDYKNPLYWLDFGLFLLQLKNDDKAFECLKEALKRKIDHKFSLVTLATMLYEKGETAEAEVCFLNLMEKKFSWLEGWAVLYLFYMKIQNIEGMGMALEMISKLAERTVYDKDPFMEADELVWTPTIVPNTTFFRTAVLFLKLKRYEWCELALSQEIHNHPGLVHYLLAAICYYKKLYVHALDHISEAKKIYGPDYAVVGLAGHCLLALGRKDEAKEQYYYAMHSYNRPDSLHLVSVQLANILFDFGEDQEARKLALVACKYSPTPYTWMLAGKFYHEENDLISAEECFSEGNQLDNRYPEIWGYLALVNAQLNRANEAELCYNQAMKNKLENDNLIQAIKQEMSKFTNRGLLHIY